MLKRIALSDLETGMFVHKFDGSWFDHPFWRARFLVENSEKLNAIRSSQLNGVIIDTSRGRDVAAPANHAPGPEIASGKNAARARFKSIRKHETPEEQPIVPTSMKQELHAAQAIADRARDSLGRTFIAARLGKAINVRAVEPVISDILASVRRNPQAFSGLMRCKLRNEVMFSHSLAVGALMVSLARQMKLTAQEIHYCGLAGVLLDSGVNYLPQSADAPVDDFRNADPKIWQQHVMLGYRALENAGNLPEVVLDACLQHHERLDGTGYPKGLEKGQITMIARMAAICDTFDFLLTKSDNNAALDPAAAIEHLRTMEGAFDELRTGRSSGPGPSTR
jgi:HD-GYP domain-containing protein (c-di-GMP phosphodiesterase class II)